MSAGFSVVCPACRARLQVEAGFRGAFACPLCGCRIKVAARPPQATTVEERTEVGPTVQTIRVQAPETPPLSSAVRQHWSEEESEPEVEEPPPPPPRSVWRGVVTFPWHLGTLRVWILLSLGLLVFVLLGTAADAVVLFYRQTRVLFAQGLLERIMPYFAAALALTGLWTGSYATSYFLAIVQETAAGNDDVHWPDDGIVERLFQFLYLAWVAAWIASPLALVAFILNRLLPGGVVPWLMFTLPFGVVFPLALLGSLSNDSHLLLFWNTALALRLGRKPHVVALLCLASPALLLPCVLLGYFTIAIPAREAVESTGNPLAAILFLMSPATAAVWAACLLVYARLLGRVAWIVSEDRTSGRKAHKRARRRRPDERRA